MKPAFLFPFSPQLKSYSCGVFFLFFLPFPLLALFLREKYVTRSSCPFPPPDFTFPPRLSLFLFFPSLVSKVAVPAHDLSTPFPHSPQRRRRGIRNWTNARPTAVGTLSSPFCIVSWTAFQNLPPFSPFPIHPTVRIAQLRVSQERQLGGTPALICCIDTCITHTCMRNYVPDRTHLIRRG